MSDQVETPPEALAARVAANPSRPLLTFYDDATGERIELSARTFENWVAKTANLLVDGLGAGPGGVRRAVLALPTHWQTSVWLMACWSAGVHAELYAIDADSAGTEPEPPDEPYLLVAAQEVLTAMTDGPLGTGADEIVGLSLHALGGTLTDPPPGVVDYAVEVRAYGDRFTAPSGVSPNDPALTVTKVTLTSRELVSQARAQATVWGVDSRDRLLVAVPLNTSAGVLSTLVTPLTSGTSVIIQRNFDKAFLDRRLTTEHVTATAGLPGGPDSQHGATGPLNRLV